MEKFAFNGEVYNDDRMYLLCVCRCTVKEEDGVIVTTIYHDNPPLHHEWCVATFKNTIRAPSTRVDHFNTEYDAIEYMKKVEPGTPLVSLSGCSPNPTIQYDQYMQWKEENNLRAYNYKDYYMEGGHNHTEKIFQNKGNDS